jgi:hypothetical protein
MLAIGEVLPTASGTVHPVYTDCTFHAHRGVTRALAYHIFHVSCNKKRLSKRQVSLPFGLHSMPRAVV